MSSRNELVPPHNGAQLVSPHNGAQLVPPHNGAQLVPPHNWAQLVSHYSGADATAPDVPSIESSMVALEILLGVKASIAAEIDDANAEFCHRGVQILFALENLQRRVEIAAWGLSQFERETLDATQQLLDHYGEAALHQLPLKESGERDGLELRYVDGVSVIVGWLCEMLSNEFLLRPLREHEEVTRLELIGVEMVQRKHLVCVSNDPLDAEIAELQSELGDVERTLESTSKQYDDAHRNVICTRNTYGSLCSTASALLVPPAAVR